MCSRRGICSSDVYAETVLSACLTEATCLQVAQSLGLQGGGKGANFAGDYPIKGLYAYSGGSYNQIAYFGTGGTPSQMITPIAQKWTPLGDVYRPVANPRVPVPAVPVLGEGTCGCNPSRRARKASVDNNVFPEKERITHTYKGDLCYIVYTRVVCTTYIHVH